VNEAADARPAVDAVSVPMDHPRDVGGLERLFAEGRLRPDEVIAVTGKTEGSGQDPSDRVDTDRAMRRFLAGHGSRPDRDIDAIPMIFTAGGIGILTPQVVVYSRTTVPAPADGSPRLAMGTSRSVVMQPEWTATNKVVVENVEAIRRAVRSGGMDVDEVEFVIGKAYHVPMEELDSLRADGRAVAQVDAETLFRTTSGSAGLAAAVALDGLPLPADEEIGTRLELWSSKASFSANAWEAVGGHGPCTQVIALGNSRGWGGHLRVGHATVQDFLDVQALGRALSRAGLEVAGGVLAPEERERVVAVYVKIGASPDGRLRGRRQVVENPHYGSEYKAAVAGAFAGALGDTLIYISGSATHQGPPGGGTIAVVVKAA
jgi:ring-opening amidohydrolase-like protein